MPVVVVAPGPDIVALADVEHPDTDATRPRSAMLKCVHII